MLIDHHCHSVVAEELDDTALGDLLTESDRPAAPGTSRFDSALGLAVRRWCPPALGLPAHAPAADYLARRRELGSTEATRRLLRAAGLDALLVDTGLTAAAGRPLLTLPALAEAAATPVHEVVRLESVAERVESGAADWPAAAAEALAAETARRGAVAVKSVLAYRHGLDVPPGRPARAALVRAAEDWLRGPRERLTDPLLLRHLLWSAAELGLPIQLHTGFGDPDLRLHRADPALLADLVRALEPTGVPLVLLHCYPYHRQAAWLAHCFPQVYVDIGLTVPHTGPRAAAVLGEVLELAPYGKVLFSTDAYGLPELYLTGAAQYRHGLAALLDDWRRDGALTGTDAERITAQVSGTNATRLYRL
ncbi:amidohydrolase family protein [Kitasatospora camelliae]|uniref:Amidohydrolase family protein n=1 Tax=Kitasatospora camelliae TaxID=3156397 RepID=A0AAU8K331_9ACTN